MSTVLKDGGPAFPGVAGESGYGNATSHMGPTGGATFVTHNQGLSIRDYFAAKVLAAILTHEKNIVCLAMNGGAPKQLGKCFAEDCYAMADAMLAERERGKEAS